MTLSPDSRAFANTEYWALINFGPKKKKEHDLNSTIFDNVVERIKEEEGFRSKPYEDHLGKLTIGFGTLLEDGISEEEAALLLRHRLLIAYNELKSTMDSHYQANLDEMPDDIQRVLLDLAYQMGVPRLMGFRKMFGALNALAYERAAHELLNSKYAEQTPARAERNANKIKSCAT